MKFHPRTSNIHVIVRGFLLQDNAIVLCRVKGENWFFLPGGHVEDGESAKTALLRELKEETGSDVYQVGEFMGVCENVFSREEGVTQHEVNLVFAVNVPSGKAVSSQEDDLEFVTVSREELAAHPVLPPQLKDCVVAWIRDGRPFFQEARQR